MLVDNKEQHRNFLLLHYLLVIFIFFFLKCQFFNNYHGVILCIPCPEFSIQNKALCFYNSCTEQRVLKTLFSSSLATDYLETQTSQWESWQGYGESSEECQCKKCTNYWGNCPGEEHYIIQTSVSCIGFSGYFSFCQQGKTLLRATAKQSW